MKQRVWEILPGALSWSILVIPSLLSFWHPEATAIFVLMYLVFWWLFKMLPFITILIGAYKRLRRDLKIDWQNRLDKLGKHGEEIIHLVIVATYKEDLPILETTIQALKDSSLSGGQVIVLLATEERDKIRARQNTEALKKKFAKHFLAFWATEHPANITGEVKGKGSNIAYAGHQAVPLIKKLGLKPENVLVTTLDADHRVDPKFLAALTYTYLTTPEPLNKTYQGLPLYFNNIWDVPFVVRMLAMGSSFWQMIESIRSYRLRNFSSQSQSLAALLKTDFWSNQTIVEDGHQYWRSYFTFKGNYSVVPIFVPIYYDAVYAENLPLTYRESYLQQRRWAWGCSDIPYVMPRLWKMREIGLGDKLTQTFRLFDGYITWAVGSLLLAFVAWTPVWFNHGFQLSVFGSNFPSVYRAILAIATIGTIVVLTVSTLILPPYPRKRRLILDWILTPLVTPFAHIIFGCIPAMDAQTRLMLGKYLEFRVTPKNVEMRTGAKSVSIIK